MRVLHARSRPRERPCDASPACTIACDSRGQHCRCQFELAAVRVGEIIQMNGLIHVHQRGLSALDWVLGAADECAQHGALLILREDIWCERAIELNGLGDGAVRCELSRLDVLPRFAAPRFKIGLQLLAQRRVGAEREVRRQNAASGRSDNYLSWCGSWEFQGGGRKKKAQRRGREHEKRERARRRVNAGEQRARSARRAGEAGAGAFGAHTSNASASRRSSIPDSRRSSSSRTSRTQAAITPLRPPPSIERIARFVRGQRPCWLGIFRSVSTDGRAQRVDAQFFAVPEIMDRPSSWDVPHGYEVLSGSRARLAHGVKPTKPNLVVQVSRGQGYLFPSRHFGLMTDE